LANARAKNAEDMVNVLRRLIGILLHRIIF